MFKIITMSLMGAVVVAGLVVLTPAPMRAQSAGPTAAPPDFTGVYYPTVGPGGAGGGQRGPAPGAAPAGQRQGPLPPPTRSAPTSDGSQGRAPNAPKLTPEYMAKWEVMRKSRMGGSSEFDPVAQCIPQGMPSMMGMLYGMEIQQTKDKITMFGELNDMYRRIYLDSRKPSQKVLDDPTYAGYSTGHWEGDTLVVDTVALHPNSLMDGFSPHSDQMTVKERIRLIAPGLLEDRITVFDPKALLEPHESARTYRKASQPNDELREFACAEGLGLAK
jgi:hypothetical protein